MGILFFLCFLQGKWSHKNLKKKPLLVRVPSFRSSYLVGAEPSCEPIVMAGPASCCRTCS